MKRVQIVRSIVVVALLLGLAAVIGIGLWPTGDAGRFDRAWAALEARNLDEARREMASARPIGSEDPRRQLLEGTLLLREGKPAAALDLFSGLDPRSDLREPLQQVTGEALAALGRLAEARLCLEPLTREHPSNAAGRRTLAGVYYDLGANDLALVELEALKQLAPDDFRPWHLAGRMYADFERYDEAIPNCEDALRRNPPPGPAAEIRDCLAGCYIATRRSEEALTLLESSPETLPVLMRRAEASLELGKIPEGRQAAEAARRLDGASCPVLSLAARGALESGETEAAIPLLEDLLTRCPHEFRDRYRLAQAYRRLGREKDAERELQAYEESQKLYRSLTDLNAQAIQEPENAAVRRELAALCRQLGRPEMAEVWERAAQNTSGGAGR